MSELNDLIQFHKDCLTAFRHLLNITSVHYLEQTIVNLEELRDRRGGVLCVKN